MLKLKSKKVNEANIMLFIKLVPLTAMIEKYTIKKSKNEAKSKKVEIDTFKFKIHVQTLYL